MFLGGKGGHGPPIVVHDNFNRPEKGVGFFSPPQIFGPAKTYCQFAIFLAFCGILRRFMAFCGVLRRFAAFCSVLRRFAAFCSVLRRFAAFCSVLRRFAAFCRVLRRFAAFCGALAISFRCRTKYFGGFKPRPLFWSVENNHAKMGKQWPCFPPKNIVSGFFQSIRPSYHF